MVVQHNINAMTAYNKLNVNVTGLKKSSEKLASGYRINRAGDDAAGLAVSEKMRSQIKGLNQAVRNAQDGINMIQTFEGAATNTHEILQRMKVLAEEAANGTYQNETDRDALQLEFDQLNDELNQIADTDFNGVAALNGGVMADGTVVNNTNSVAATPTISYNQNSQGSGSIVYAENVNGSIDSSGNGDIIINGVRVTLSAGAGTNKQDNDGSTYTVKNITVTAGGSINATVKDDDDTAQVTVTEVFEVKRGANEITINGKTYTLKWGITDQWKHGDETLTKDEYDTAAKNVADLKAAYEAIKDDPAKTVEAAQAKLDYDAAADDLATWVDIDDKFELQDIVNSNGQSLVKDGDTVTAEQVAKAAGFDGALTLTTNGDGSGTVTTATTYNVAADGTVRNANNSTIVGTVEVSDGVSKPNAYSHGSRNLTYTNSLTLQTGARSKDAVNFNFKYSTNGIGTLKSDLDISSRGLGTNQLRLNTQEEANFAIDQIDNAINKTSMVRATFGAIQNRLEYKIDNLTTTSTNLQEAESGIRDTDMASEMMNYTKYSILQQAAQSMLAQANQQPQSILQLLG